MEEVQAQKARQAKRWKTKAGILRVKVKDPVDDVSDVQTTSLGSGAASAMSQVMQEAGVAVHEARVAAITEAQARISVES